MEWEEKKRNRVWAETPISRPNFTCPNRARVAQVTSRGDDRWTASVSRALAHATDAWDPQNILSLALATSVRATLVRSSILLGRELETEPRALATGGYNRSPAFLSS
jgi:hypothetical protein